LCYGSDHHKVVSADGTMFKPNGTFTGGPTPPRSCREVLAGSVFSFDLASDVCQLNAQT